MEGPGAVTLQSPPEADADFLLDVGRVDAVLVEAVGQQKGLHLGAVGAKERLEARLDGVGGNEREHMGLSGR